MAPSNNVWTVQSLQRYRPIILALTALAAGCSIYYIHQSVWSSAGASIKQPRLHRSNARRRRRLRPRPWSHYVRANGPFSLDFLSDRTADEHLHGYEYHVIHLRNSQPRAIPLRRNLLAIAHLEPSSDDEDDIEQCVRARYELQTVFLDFYFLGHIPPEHVITNDEETQIIAALQQNGNFTPHITGTALQRHRDGILIGDLDFWETQQQRVRERLQPLTNVERESTPSPESERLETVADAQSEHSWRGENDEDGSSKEGQSLLHLLYKIAEEQARKDGYVHCGVSCNSCSAMPIRGIRYRCANCVDYDLCEQCEALQIHPKTHLFYKVRLPAPYLGQPRQPQEIWYPGKPGSITEMLPRKVIDEYAQVTGYQNAEVEALWEQFRCLAATEWPEDPRHYRLAMNRSTFDKCFIPTTTSRSLPPNLIYDRMFSLYDTNNDGLIGFEEFIKGLASVHKKSASERLKQIFKGYDIDNDGFIDRKDFLRMFRAYYSLTKEFTRAIFMGMEDELNESEAQHIVNGGQPVSSAFSGAIPLGERIRGCEGKASHDFGDFGITDNMGVIDEDDKDEADPDELIADHAEEREYGYVTGRNINISGVIRNIYDQPWPPQSIRMRDVQIVLKREIEPEQVKNEADRRRIRRVSHGRIARDWQQRQTLRQRILKQRGDRRSFYFDNCGTSQPNAESDTHIKGYLADSSDGKDQLNIEDSVKLMLESPILDLIEEFYLPLNELERPILALELIDFLGWGWDEAAITRALGGYARHLAEVRDFVRRLMQIFHDTKKQHRPENMANPPSSSLPASRRSRSSSKVRFEDGLTADEDQDSRSVTSMSSRSIPTNERWGGFEVPEPEQNLGREVLYQITQEAYDELINPFVIVREDLAVRARETESIRIRHRAEISAAVESPLLLKSYLNVFQELVRTTLSYPPERSRGLSTAWMFTDFIRQSFENYRNNMVGELCIVCLEKRERNYIKFLGFCEQCGIAGRYLRQYRQRNRSGLDLCPNCEKIEAETPLLLRYCSDCERNSKSITQLRAIISGQPPPSALDDKPQTSDTGPKSKDANESSAISNDNSAQPTIEGNGQINSPGPITTLTTVSSNTEESGEVIPRGPTFKTTPAPNSPTDVPATSVTGDEQVPHLTNGYKDSNSYPVMAEDLHAAVAAFNAANPSLEEEIASKPLIELLAESGYEAGDLDTVNVFGNISSSNPNANYEFTDSSPSDPTLPQNRPSTVDDDKNKNDPPSAAPPQGPDTATLKFWGALYLLEAEDRERGGPGRISFAEFEEVMKGERGAGLGFLGEWLDKVGF